MDEALQSEWLGLSPHLIATFYEVTRDGKRVNEKVTVKAPLINDPAIDIQQNWQSSFEAVGTSTLPTLQQMLQSGALNPIAKIVDQNAKNIGVNSNLSQALSTVEGKSSITRLNSIQVWSGSPPLKITVTALFRAWADAVSEVEKPADQLVTWCLPVHLEGDATVLSKLYDKGVDPSAVFPSTVPVLVAMRYKNRTFLPLVIESLNFPLGGPINKDGKFIELSVAMTLCSISSIDRSDWLNYSENAWVNDIKVNRIR